MIDLQNFRGFCVSVLGVMLFTWCALVVLPWIARGHLPPITDPDSTDITPWDKPNLAHAGEPVYAANGCAECHTQQVRPATSGADLIRGWGTSRGDDGKEITRRTYARDYIWEHQVFLGHSREGADLANVGARMTTAQDYYRLLYDPYIANPHCSMPAYRFLFTTRRIAGQPSANALVLPELDAPPAGFEIVPTPQAQALVAYLLALKKDYKLPTGDDPLPPAAKS